MGRLAAFLVVGLSLLASGASAQTSITADNFISRTFVAFCLTPRGDTTKLISLMDGLAEQHPNMIKPLDENGRRTFFGTNSLKAWIVGPPPPGAQPAFLSASTKGFCEVLSAGTFKQSAQAFEAELRSYAAEKRGTLSSSDSSFLNDAETEGSAYTLDLPPDTAALVVTKPKGESADAQTTIRMIAVFSKRPSANR